MEEQTNRYPVKQASIVLVTMIFAVSSVILSLFEFEVTIVFAKITIFASMVALVLLLYHILTTSPRAAFGAKT